ncbi:beta/gamma crystallin-related protein [Sphingopyxis sp. MWB1]|uniref:beta/gamma crystallin-related protein n=1 Tax=Sphingopyxis sp. MWB1 TaxID=1537715 RepID=UPI000AE837E9|nr:beta/gamma crystallin-related protein [Sphingopyxis sp. MWB1]
MTSIRKYYQYMIGAVIAGAVMSGPPSVAQTSDKMYRPSEATIYRDASYRGPAMAVSEEKSDLGLSWPVNSIRVGSGSWQLCERAYFRGQCRTVNRDTARLNNSQRGMTVQSIRPLGGGGGGGGDWQNPPARGESARGSFAEFHTQPATNGRRVLACASGSSTASCAARTADNWCRSIGWGGSAREHMESVDRRVYLADVLCVRTGY